MKRGRKANRILDYYIGIPLVRIISGLRLRRKMPGDVRRVGVICSAALGDTLLASAAIADLRAHFRTQSLTLFCTPQNLATAQLIPGIDALVLYRLDRPLTAIRRMRSAKLDLLIDLSGWQRLTAIFTMLAGARFIAGFRTRWQRRHYGYDHVIDHFGDCHEIENFRAMVRSLNIEAGSDPCIEVPPAKLPDELVGRQFVVLHLWPSGDRSWLREWPQEQWIELSRRLCEGLGDSIFVVTGSPSDFPRSKGFVEKMTSAGLNAMAFPGGNGFSTLCQILLAARVVVSTNTGIMHLAAILGAPTVSINGPTSNLRWGPVGRNAVGVEAPGQGCGFLDLGFEFDGNPQDCMARTTVDQVLAAAFKVIEAGAGRAGCKDDAVRLLR